MAIPEGTLFDYPRCLQKNDASLVIARMQVSELHMVTQMYSICAILMTASASQLKYMTNGNAAAHFTGRSNCIACGVIENYI